MDNWLQKSQSWRKTPTKWSWLAADLSAWVKTLAPSCNPQNLTIWNLDQMKRSNQAAGCKPFSVRHSSSRESPSLPKAYPGVTEAGTNVVRYHDVMITWGFPAHGLPWLIIPNILGKPLWWSPAQCFRNYSSEQLQMQPGHNLHYPRTCMIGTSWRWMKHGATGPKATMVAMVGANWILSSFTKIKCMMGPKGSKTLRSRLFSSWIACPSLSKKTSQQFLATKRPSCGFFFALSN